MFQVARKSSRIVIESIVYAVASSRDRQAYTQDKKSHLNSQIRFSERYEMIKSL